MVKSYRWKSQILSSNLDLTDTITSAHQRDGFSNLLFTAEKWRNHWIAAKRWWSDAICSNAGDWHDMIRTSWLSSTSFGKHPKMSAFLKDINILGWLNCSTAVPTPTPMLSLTLKLTGLEQWQFTLKITLGWARKKALYWQMWRIKRLLLLSQHLLGLRATIRWALGLPYLFGPTASFKLTLKRDNC